MSRDADRKASFAAPGGGEASPGSRRLRLSWVEAGRIATIAAQLVLLFLLIRTFPIEGAALLKVFAICVVGFLIHAALPLSLRMPFFVLLSLAGIVVLLGPVQGLWLVVLGMILIGLAHLPTSFRVRIVLILAFGGVLVACRSRVFPCPWLSAVWPVFGAMFMFRLIVYLYDLKNRAAAFGLWRSMAYFFMIPNLVFTVFPVVD